MQYLAGMKYIFLPAFMTLHGRDLLLVINLTIRKLWYTDFMNRLHTSCRVQ
uniref:Uncharacterized protein n=1 Tax=Setaria italica TaxID=4555 RepID=K4AI05_SETIT